MSFYERDHTADIIMQVSEKTLEDLFSSAGLALMHIMYRNVTGTTTEKTIFLSEPDRDTLMHDFLSELLFVSECDNIVFSTITITLSGCDLVATLRGEPFNQDRHAGGMEVKGISYSGLHIVKDEDGYTLDILFDV